MKTYARIEDGIVKELIKADVDVAALFHPSILWADVGCNEVQVGWLQVMGGGFAAPAAAEPVPMPPKLSDLMAEIAELRAQVALLQPAA